MDENQKETTCKNKELGDLQKLYKFVDIKVKHAEEIRGERSTVKKEFHIKAGEVEENAKNETKKSRRKRKERKYKKIPNGKLKKGKMSLVEGAKLRNEKKERKVKVKAGSKRVVKYSGLFRRVEGVRRCLACPSTFLSDQGVYRHLATKVCGFGPGEVGAPKRDWSPLYRREGGLLRCSSCLLEFHQMHQVHRHLASSPCGAAVEVQGASPRALVPQPREGRRSYQGMYKQTSSSSWACSSCGLAFMSQHGVHNHLQRTTCGFGERPPSGGRRSLRSHYRREGGEHLCSHCTAVYRSIRGVHNHLSTAHTRVVEGEEGGMEEIGVGRENDAENGVEEGEDVEGQMRDGPDTAVGMVEGQEAVDEDMEVVGGGLNRWYLRT